MKKFTKAIKDFFTTNIGIKVLAVVLAVFVVLAINVPNFS